MNNYAPPLQGTADNLAKYGRYGDSMLVHMNPAEVQGIASLVPGGKLPLNPVTGQPEAFAFLIPLLGSWLGTAALGSTMGTALAGAIGSGVATAIAEKDLGKGLAAGIMGYGLGKVFGAGGLGGGETAITPDAATAAITPDGAFGDLAPQVAPRTTLPWGEGGGPRFLGTTSPANVPTLAGSEGVGITPDWSFDKGGLGAMGEAVMEPGTILPIGAGGAELARLEAEEDLEDYYAGEDADREGKLARTEEEADRATRRSIYDYGLPTSGILPRDPRYAAHGGLISLNPRDYADKRQGLSRLMGEPVRMQAGGTSPTSVSHSEMQASLRGPLKISPSQMQQLSASGYRPGIDPELQYFRHEPFPSVMDPLDPNRAFIPTGDPSIPYQPGLTSTPSPQAPDPMANIYGGEGPRIPSSPGGPGYWYGDPQPRRGDFDAETGAMEYMKAMRGWRAAQGMPQPGSDRTRQEQAKIMMLSLGQIPPHTGDDPRTIMEGSEVTSLPRRSDYDAEGGRAEYFSALRNWNAQVQPPMQPPVAAVAPPVAAAAPIAPPIRSSYEAEGGASEYRSDLRDWNAAQTQVPLARSAPVVNVPVAPTGIKPGLRPPPAGISRLPAVAAAGPSVAAGPPIAAAPIAPAIGRRPRRSDYEAEGGASEYRSDYRDWLAAKNAASGYQGGGITELVEGAPEAAMPVGPPMDPAMMDPAMMDPAMMDPTAGIDPATIQLVEQTAMAVLGQVPQEQADAIIQAFIQQFGPEAFQMLRQQVLASVEPGAQTEGMVAGQGDGMSDEIQGMIGDQQRVAVSPGEFIVPADVVSGIGNGSSDAGASELDRMMADIRQARTGMTQQPPAINPRGAMPV